MWPTLAIPRVPPHIDMKISILLVPALLALTASASAQTTVTWTGSASSTWTDANNWSPAQVPGPLDHAIITAAPNPTSLFGALTVAQLTMNGGGLTLEDNSTLTVSGNATFNGGTLNFATVGASFDTLDIHGNLLQTGGALGTTTNQSRIFVAGDWSADTSFTMASGWVYLDGPDSTIGGAAPAFQRLNLVTGINTLTSDVDVTGQLVMGAGTTAGPGWVEFNGSVAPHGGAGKLIHQARIIGGLNNFYSTTFGQLEVTGGTLRITDNATLAVSGDARLIGGTLDFATVGASFDTLDVAGDLIQTGTLVGTTSSAARIFVAGDWSADTPFALDEGWVYLDGAASSIGGLAPAFKRLNLPTGVKTVNSKTLISGTLTSSGGASTGPEWFEVVGNVQAISTGANSIHKLRIAAAAVPFSNSTIGQLEMTGGSMLIQDNVTLSVTGDMQLLGGTLDFATVGASFDTIDIEGNFYQNGGILGTATDQLRIFCAGNWRSDTGFTLLNGWVYLDGLVDTTIDGLNTAFNNVRITNAKRTVLGGLHARGDLDVQAGAALELLTDLELGGNLDCFQVGASITGSAIIKMTASGYIKTNSTAIPHCEVSAGLRTLKNSTLASLNLLGGEFQVSDNSTCQIVGDASFNGGVLSFATVGASFDTIDIDGNLSQSGATIGTTTSSSRLFVAGDWIAANPFELDNGWVYLDGGDATIGGPAPTFKRLSLVSGIKTVNSDAAVSGTILSTGGSTAGAAYLDCVANVQPINTGANLVNRLRVSGGVVPFYDSRLGELEITGGELRVEDNRTLTVDGDARLLGGTLSFATVGASFDFLDVNGNVTESGTIAGTSTTKSRFLVAGNWTGNGSFVMPLGWVQLDGSPASTIGGASPRFQNLGLFNGTRTLISDTNVGGDVDVAAGATFDVATRVLDVAGSWGSTATGAAAIGVGPILFSGDGGLLTNAAGLPPVAIIGGTRSSSNATVEALTLTAGALVIQDNSTLHVLGDAAFDGGSLGFATVGASFDTLDIDGNLSQSATTIGTTSNQSRIYVAGDWMATSAFGLGSGWVYLDGGAATISGPAPSFRRLNLVSGIKTVTSDATVSGTLLSSGGSTAGPAYLDCVASTQPVSSGANLIARLRVSAGSVPFKSSRIGELEITGGELRVEDNATLTVDGDARLIGGTLAFATVGASWDTLDIGGSLTQTGTLVGTSTSKTRIFCAGDWSAGASFTLGSGTVYLDGSSTTQLAGPALTFPALRILNGIRQVPGDSSLQASSVAVESSGALEVTGDALRPVGTPITVDGRLSVTSGGRLAPDPTSSILINPVGRLELLGAPGNPAILEGLGGGFACEVKGMISAREFEVRNPAAPGLLLTGVVAPAPDDLRNGIFTGPSPVIGSTLLTLNASVNSPLPGLSFEDPLGVGTFNVRRDDFSMATIVSAAGNFGSEVFEDDVKFTLNWTSATPSVVSGFTATAGAEQAALSWVSTAESNPGNNWRITSAPAASGPWSLLTDVPFTGPGSYSFTATGLAANVPVYFRLQELQTAAVLYLHGSADVTPWSASLPPNVVTVGPGGTFASIQAAVDAATGGSHVVSVAAGTYPSFTVFAPLAAEVHVIADGSGPVLVDASSAPIEIAATAFGQVVELVGLDVTSGGSNRAVFVHDNLGSVLLDTVVATAGAGQAGVHVQSSLAVNVGRCTLTGSPGLSIGAAGTVYIGRGTVDQMDLGPGASVETSGVTIGVTTSDPAASLVAHAGVMPDLNVGSYQSLGVPFTLTFEAAPASFYQLATSAGLIPIDLGDPGFWQMLLLVNITNYTLIGSGFTDGLGQASLAAELPGDPALLGATLPLQGWAVALVPTISVRFSNLRTLVAMP